MRADRLAAFEVSRPLLLPPLLVLHYPGSRPLSGRYWHDALAENVQMAGFFDHRDIDGFAEALESVLQARADARPGQAAAGRDDIGFDATGTGRE